jgi:hypothetical protein
MRQMCMRLLAVACVLSSLTAVAVVAGENPQEALPPGTNCGAAPSSGALLATIFAPAEAPAVQAGEDEEALEAPEAANPTENWVNQTCVPGIVCWSISDCYPGRCHVDLYAGTHLCVCP